MKKLFVLLVFFIMVPAFGAYKLVLKNGVVLELSKKPDLTQKHITAQMLTGKRIIFPVRIVDMAATKLANRKAKIPAKAGVSVNKKKPPVQDKVISMPATKGKMHKAPLVITNATLKKDAAAAKPGTENSNVENPPEENGGEQVEGDSRMNPVVDDYGHGEEYWQNKFQENKDLQDGIVKELGKMQLKLNGMASRRLQTDDELEKRRLTGKIQKLQRKIDNARAQLQQLKKEKEKLLDAARTSGALPGWYRDYEN